MDEVNELIETADQVYQECLAKAAAMPGLHGNVQSQVQVASTLFCHVMGQCQPQIVLQDRVRPGRDGALSPMRMGNRPGVGAEDGFGRKK